MLSLSARSQECVFFVCTNLLGSWRLQSWKFIESTFRANHCSAELRSLTGTEVTAARLFLCPSEPLCQYKCRPILRPFFGKAIANLPFSSFNHQPSPAVLQHQPSSTCKLWRIDVASHSCAVGLLFFSSQNCSTYCLTIISKMQKRSRAFLLFPPALFAFQILHVNINTATSTLLRLFFGKVADCGRNLPLLSIISLCFWFSLLFYLLTQNN